MDGTLTQLIQHISDDAAEKLRLSIEVGGLRMENQALRQQMADLQAAYDSLRALVPEDQPATNA